MGFYLAWVWTITINFILDTTQTILVNSTNRKNSAYSNRQFSNVINYNIQLVFKSFKNRYNSKTNANTLYKENYDKFDPCRPCHHHENGGPFTDRTFVFVAPGFLSFLFLIKLYTFLLIDMSIFNFHIFCISFKTWLTNSKVCYLHLRPHDDSNYNVIQTLDAFFERRRPRQRNHVWTHASHTSYQIAGEDSAVEC